MSTEGPGEPLTWSWARLAPSILHADLGGPAPVAAPLTTTWMKPGCAPLPATHRAPVSQACVHPSLTHAAWGRSGSLLPGPLALWLVPVTWPPWRPSPAETRPAHPRSSPRDLAESCPPPPRAHVCFVSGLRLHSPLRSSLPEAVVRSTASPAQSGHPRASLPPRHCGPQPARARPCCHVPGERRPDGNGLSLDTTRCPPKSLASCQVATQWGRGTASAR